MDHIVLMFHNPGGHNVPAGDQLTQNGGNFLQNVEDEISSNRPGQKGNIDQFVFGCAVDGCVLESSRVLEGKL